MAQEDFYAGLISDCQTVLAGLPSNLFHPPTAHTHVQILILYITKSYLDFNNGLSETCCVITIYHLKHHCSVSVIATYLFHLLSFNTLSVFVYYFCLHK